MKYALDASVAACWVLRNPLQVKALKLRTEYQQHIHQLIAPAHFSGEIASALTKAERQKLIPVGDAQLLIQDSSLSSFRWHRFLETVLHRKASLHALSTVF